MARRLTERGTVCGRLGCDRPAAFRIKPQYDPELFRCKVHAKETHDVYVKFDNRQTSGTTMRPIAAGGVG